MFADRNDKNHTLLYYPPYYPPCFQNTVACQRSFYFSIQGCAFWLQDCLFVRVERFVHDRETDVKKN